MDKLKSTRKVIRSLFTKAYNAFQVEKQKLSPNLTRLQMQFALIRDKASELSELSHKIQDAMFNADEEEETLTGEVDCDLHFSTSPVCHLHEYAVKYYQRLG